MNTLIRGATMSTRQLKEAQPMPRFTRELQLLIALAGIPATLAAGPWVGVAVILFLIGEEYLP